MKPQAAPNALLDSTFIALPLGSIKPQGWLRNQLRIQADGLTGHLEEHWPDVGPESGWLGGSGESWERGPYYLDGLVPLAYLLGDNELERKAQKWIEWALASQAEDGRFGPTHLTTVNTEVRNRDWWQDMIMLKVLTQYHEATQDPRVIPFMTRYFAYLSETLEADPLQEWARARGQDLLLSIHWLYDRTEDAELLELAEVVRKQTIDWTSIFAKFPFWRKQEQWDHRTHVVNVAMAIKAPAVFYRQTGDESDRGAVYDGIHSLMTHHGQAHGLFSGDEWLSGTHPSQGVELCAVVEYMFSLENLVRILGDGRFADVLERVAFNALPAAISPNWDSHQYDQQVYPTTPWQYALVEDARFDVGYHAISYQPFQPGSPPVSLETQGQLISNWVMVNSSAGDPPLNPKAYSDNTDTLTLVPYGCARLRIGEFPVV